MKKLSLNKIQLIILATLLATYLIAIISYRIFVERPELEKNITLLSEREVSTLILSTRNIIDSLSLLTRDHAAWTSAYNFMADKNAQFIEETLTEDTFANLKIDGFFLIDKNFNTVASSSYNHLTKENITLDFNNFAQYPENKNMFPAPITTTGAPKKSGIIATNLGIALFSAVQIRDSTLEGEHRGWLVLLKLISPELFEELSTYILASISYSTIKEELPPPNSFNLSDDIDNKVRIEKVRKYSYLVIPDINNKPLLLLSIAHSNNIMPPIIDAEGVTYSVLLGILVILIYAIVNQYLVMPAIYLSREIKHISGNSDLNLLEKNYSILELQNIKDNFNYFIEKVIHQTELLSEQAHIDPLTNIPNRRLFEEVYAKQMQLFIRTKISFALVMADIDYFKKYNDSMGHVSGDKALFEVAQILQKSFPRQTDLCARFGGEEFIIFISDINQTDLTKKLEGIIQSFKSLNMPHPDSISAPYITVSLGAYIIEEVDIVDFDIPLKSVIEKVDSALYNAKEAGRNTFIIYSNPDDMASIADFSKK